MEFTSRKFALAAVAMLASVLALFLDKIGGGEWIGAIGVILGLYGGANIMENKNGGSS